MADSRGAAGEQWLAALLEASAACDAVADALACCAADVNLAYIASSALCTLCAHGARFSDAAAAATAARGVAEALTANLLANAMAKQTAVNIAVVLCVLLPTDRSRRADVRFKSALAAFLRAGGLDALFATLDAYGDDDETLESLLAGLKAVLLVTPREHLLPLSAKGGCYEIFTRAVQRTTLVLAGREFSMSAANLLAGFVGDDATVHVRLACAGVRDAAIACLSKYGKLSSGDADAAGLLRECADAVVLAAQSGIVPSDVAAALHALARAAPTPAVRAREGCFTALRSRLELPGVVDVAIAGGLPDTLAAAVRAACAVAPDGDVCTDALFALVHFSLRCDEAKHAVLHAEGIDLALHALRSHPRDAGVAHSACELLYRLSVDCEQDAGVAISAADGWIPLVAALRGHGAGNAALAKYACNVLAMGASDADCCSAVAAAGAIPALTGAMRAHIGDDVL